MTEFNLDEKIKNAIEDVEIPLPILNFQVLGVMFSIYKRLEFGISFLETFPYKADGDIPLIFLNIGFAEIMFESKRVYKYLYKLKYKEELNI